MCLHEVLGVLEDDERLSFTFEQACVLAEAEHARLTLAKTTDPGWLMRWFAPAGVMAAALPATYYAFDEIASGTVARVAEFVPESIPLTTLLIGRPTSRALRELLRTGAYDALVASERLLSHCHKVARELDRLGIRTVAVPVAELTRDHHFEQIGAPL